MASNKPHLNIITAGHVDQGKSTIVGRLLFDTGAIKDEELRKLQELAKEYKIEGGEFAFIMDREKEERQRGMTIDIMHRSFETNRYFFTIIDVPGHRDFVKNMITGAAQADGCILVVSAKPGEGVQEQTKEHVFLIKVLGINQIVVAITKMDTVKWDQAIYDKIKNDISSFLKPVGFKVDTIPFVPVSAQVGDNITKKTTNMAWYKGPSLTEALDGFQIPPRSVDKPLRLPVQDVYTITGIGTVPVGKVETGVMKPGDMVVFMPSGVKGEVKTIEMHHEQISEAKPGDNVGFSVRGIEKNAIKRGDVVGHVNNPPMVAKEFTAQIVVLYHPNVLTKGYTPVFHCHTSQVACKITEIVRKIDPRTGATLQQNPDFIKMGDAAVIKCVPTKPLVIEEQKNFPQLAKFAIRDMGQTIAAGVCLEIVPATLESKK